MISDILHFICAAIVVLIGLHILDKLDRIDNQNQRLKEDIENLKNLGNGTSSNNNVGPLK
jgi:hypothetical protein